MALVMLLAAYPVLMTAALWTGLVERLLRSEDLKVEIDNPAWTIWPGRLHLDGLRVYMNGETQFILSAEELRANIQVLPLVKRRFFVSSLYAENVSYRMRLQMKDAELASPRVAAFPNLEGLPGVPTKREEKAEQTEKRESDWTVQVENIDAKVSDLWFMEYRYVGDGQLRGGFLRGPNIMRVDTSVQDLGPGDLTFGEKQLIAKNFRGQVQAEIPKLDPEQHADAGFFEFVEATIKLDANVQSLKHVQAYLDRIKVRGGAGPLQVRVTLAKGALSRDSTMSYAAEKVELIGDGFGVKSDWQLDLQVDTNGPNAAAQSKAKSEADKSTKASIQSAKGAKPTAALPWLRSKSDITYVSLARPGGPPFTIQIHDHEHVVSLDSTKISDKTKLNSARLSFPKILTTDLDDIDALAGKDSDVETNGGSARASLTLNLDDKGSLRGPLRARLDKAKFSIADIQLGGSGQLDSYVNLNPASKRTVLSDVAVDLKDVEFHAGDEHVKHWWMKLSGERLSAVGMPPEQLTTDLSIVAKDAEPVLEGLAEKDKLPDIVAKLTSLDDLKLEAKVRKRGKVIDVMLDTLESDIIDFSGRVYTNGKQSLIALLIGGKTVSLGIFKRGEETDYGIQAGRQWLNDKLEHFPPPEEKVRGQKP